MCERCDHMCIRVHLHVCLCVNLSLVCLTQLFLASGYSMLSRLSFLGQLGQQHDAGGFIQPNIDPCACVHMCVRLWGRGKISRKTGAEPSKGGMFYNGKFDIKSNQLLQLIPTLTA